MPLDRWGNDDNANTQRHQELVDLANESHHVHVAGDLDAYHTPGGRALVDTSRYRVFDFRIARIIPPENSDFTYTDCRYRIQILSLKQGALYSSGAPGVGDDVRFQPDPEPSMFPEGGDNGYAPSDTSHVAPGERVTATNLAEMEGYGITNPDLDASAGTHVIVEDGKTWVHAFCAYDRETPSQPHWFFFLTPPSTGQYQMMVMQVVSQNQEGHDYVKAHPM